MLLNPHGHFGSVSVAVKVQLAGIVRSAAHRDGATSTMLHFWLNSAPQANSDSLMYTTTPPPGPVLPTEQGFPSEHGATGGRVVVVVVVAGAAVVDEELLSHAATVKSAATRIDALPTCDHFLERL